VGAHVVAFVLEAVHVGLDSFLRVGDVDSECHAALGAEGGVVAFLFRHDGWVLEG
jgi:hypothetical protein